MITIDCNDLPVVISESSTKGNQLKFRYQDYWIKLDNCYEGLAEELCFHISRYIFNFVSIPYKTDQFMYNGEVYNGCISETMYKDGGSFLSFRRLLNTYGYNIGIFIKYTSVIDNMKSVIDVLYNITGLNLTDYICKILLFDALIQNEDRHPMNLGVWLGSDNIFYTAPCFDNGSSLFCVDWSYNKCKSLSENIRCANNCARPFSKFYDKQVEAAVRLGGRLRLDYLGLQNFILNYNNTLYSPNIVNRTKQVVLHRLDKYRGIIYE